MNANPQRAMAKKAAEPQRVPVKAALALIEDAMVAVGHSKSDAAKVAELMVAADLSGADAHGIFRLPHFVRRIQAGGVNPKPNIVVNRTAPATAMVEGDNGLGHLVMAKATDTAIALARENGVAWVGARRSNHAGAAGVYAEMPVHHGMACIYSVVASANHMPLFGGAEQLLGTNPIAFGIPAGEEPPVVLDIATTVVSYGTVKAYRLAGREMPEGWMVDAKTGKPLTDPARSAEGLLLPMAGYKGSGLALVLGLLGGTMNNAYFGRDIVDFNADVETECNTGHFIIVVDISRFVPLEKFKADVDRHLRDLKNSKTLPGFDEIRLPGEMRRKRQLDRAANGLALGAEVLTQLDQLAAELQIKPLAAR
jgi:LDH2 family malate/lactate/ureidoglycolate dehydrogenase